MNPLNLLFRSGNQVLFVPQTLLKLGDLSFIVPVDVGISLRKKIVITEIYGADFSVKEDFGMDDFRITIDGKIGDTDSSTGSKICGVSQNVGALDFLNRLAKLYREKGPYEISDVNQFFAGNVLNQVIKKVDQAFDFPFGGTQEPEGILNKLGITRVVLMNMDVYPAGSGHYRFHVDCLSDPADEDVFETANINIFLEEQ